MAQTEAQMLEEISRLSGAIDRHKSQQPARGGYRGARPHAPSHRKPYAKPANSPQEVVLGGQVFQSRGGKSLSLVRKGAPSSRPTPSTSTPAPTPQVQHPVQAQPLVHAGKNKLVAANRLNAKPRPPPPAILAAKRARLAKLAKTLHNVQSHRTKPGFGKPKMIKRKVVDKPCRFWTRTGICQKGDTCPYQHDPNKTAICPRFVAGDCPNTPLTCPLSHDPTPERMPLCVHFQNAGRCRLGDACPYPHVYLGAQTKSGVCRDFAVLGYCARGVDCEKTHVRECPDFAERGVCGTKGCKLPHVIRANRGKMDAAARAPVVEQVVAPQPQVKQQLGDEFVSLMFEESDDEDGENDEEETADEDVPIEEVETGDDDELEAGDDEQDVDALLSEPDDEM